MCLCEFYIPYFNRLMSGQLNLGKTPMGRTGGNYVLDKASVDICVSVCMYLFLTSIQ